MSLVDRRELPRLKGDQIRLLDLNAADDGARNSRKIRLLDLNAADDSVLRETRAKGLA